MRYVRIQWFLSKITHFMPIQYSCISDAKPDILNEVGATQQQECPPCPAGGDLQFDSHDSLVPSLGSLKDSTPPGEQHISPDAEANGGAAPNDTNTGQDDHTPSATTSEDPAALNEVHNGGEDHTLPTNTSQDPTAVNDITSSGGESLKEDHTPPNPTRDKSTTPTESTPKKHNSPARKNPGEDHALPPGQKTTGSKDNIPSGTKHDPLRYNEKHDLIPPGTTPDNIPTGTISSDNNKGDSSRKDKCSPATSERKPPATASKGTAKKKNTTPSSAPTAVEGSSHTSPEHIYSQVNKPQKKKKLASLD